MKKDDFGFYGKGLDGYAHYRQAFDQTQRTPGEPPDGGNPDADDRATLNRPQPHPPAPPSGGRTRQPGEISGGRLVLICVLCLALIALLTQCG